MVVARWRTVLAPLMVLALVAQRMNIRLPKVFRNRLRLLLLRLTRAQLERQTVEDWSTPLIVKRPVPVESTACMTAGTNDGPDDQWSTGPRVLALPLDAAGPGPHTNSCDVNTDLRCLLVTSSLDAGGMDEIVVFLARRLPRHGIRTAVLHASAQGTSDGAPTGRLGRLLVQDGVETVDLAGTAATNWLKAWQPDVISAHDPPAWVLEAANNLSIPYVDTLHGMHSLFNRDKAIEAERAHKLAGIIAVSDLVRRQYLAINPSFSVERIITIPNGVDDWRRVPYDRERARALLGVGDEYLFVSLARHCLQKNTFGLVAAFEDVGAKYREAHLVIAGRPDDVVYLTQVMRLRAALRCSDRIHVRDHTSNPSQLLAAADGFVLDSFFEGWSLASMEALHAGVPVVLSEVGGAREQVGACEECGHLVPNPLGDPLQVNWGNIRGARYARQANREALVAAMSSLITNRRFHTGARQRLIIESATRFHPDVCLRAHAKALAAAANGDVLLDKKPHSTEPLIP